MEYVRVLMLLVLVAVVAARTTTTTGVALTARNITIDNPKDLYVSPAWFYLSPSGRVAVFTWDPSTWVVVMDVTTGKKLCEFEGPHPDEYGSQDFITVTDEVGYIATSQAAVAFHLSTCKTVWNNTAWGGSSGVAVNAKEGLVYMVSKDGATIGALNSTTGEKAWYVNKSPSTIDKYQPFVTRDGKTIVTSESGSLVGYDAAQNGKQLWKVPSIHPWVTNAAFKAFEDEANEIVLLTHTGVYPFGNFGIAKIDAASGKLMWSRSLGGSSDAAFHIVPINTRAGYFCYNGTDVALLEKRTGNSRVSAPTNMEFQHGLVRAGEYILSAGKTTTLKVFNAVTGEADNSFYLGGMPIWTASTTHGAAVLTWGTLSIITHERN